ncbi:MAG: TIR domain-containing protein [Solirubrobacterales bacterium]
MKVFVSWSGDKSRDVAHAFRQWLPSVLHAVDPFVSSRDIRAGTRWQAEIAAELDDTDFGLICVTKENQVEQWLNFEAGALAKSVDSSRVVPLAIDLAPADIANPLGQFQAMRLNQEEIGEVLVSMNEASMSPITDENLRKAVDKWWPDLEEELDQIFNRSYEDDGLEPRPGRSDRELLEELLDSVRGMARHPTPPSRRPSSDREVMDDLVELLQTAGVDGWTITQTGTNFVISLPEKESSSALRRGADALMDRHDVAISFSMEDKPGAIVEPPPVDDGKRPE